MSIYPVLPYVYQCVHKITSKIYIGSRTNKNQKLQSHLDLPQYRTSSKIVKPIFDEFDWFIVAEFFDPKDAYNFEQQLIHEQWMISKEMSLNQVCYYDKKSFNAIGISRKGIIHSEEHNRKVGDALRGKSLSEEHKQNMRKPKSKPRSEEHIRKLRYPRSETHKHNLKASKRVEHSFLTPDGFVIENITMSELCSQFNLSYQMASRKFKNNKSYKGFNRLV